MSRIFEGQLAKQGEMTSEFWHEQVCCDERFPGEAAEEHIQHLCLLAQV